jgi:hypothetical protein
MKFDGSLSSQVLRLALDWACYEFAAALIQSWVSAGSILTLQSWNYGTVFASIVWFVGGYCLFCQQAETFLQQLKTGCLKAVKVRSHTASSPLVFFQSVNTLAGARAAPPVLCDWVRLSMMLSIQTVWCNSMYVIEPSALSSPLNLPRQAQLFQ